MSHSRRDSGRQHRVKRKRRKYHLEDLYVYVRPYGLPLQAESSLSKIGFIIRQYLYDKIEFKVNCRMGVDDRLVTCCASLLPATSSSAPSAQSFTFRKNRKNQHSDDIAANTDFFVAFNVSRAQSGDEPNPVLFSYPQYFDSNLSTSSSRCIQLDFLVRKQIKHMVMATYIPKPKRKSSSKSRRGSSPKFKHNCSTPNSPDISMRSESNNNNSNENPTLQYGSNSFTKLKQSVPDDLPGIAPISVSAKPFAKSRRVKFQSQTPRATMHNERGRDFQFAAVGNKNAPSMIPDNLAIIYPQDNILWSYFQNKARMIEQYAWMPIVSLWRQKEVNIVYMLRGSSSSSMPAAVASPKVSESIGGHRSKVRSNRSSSSVARRYIYSYTNILYTGQTRHVQKKKNRSKSVTHERTFTPSAPIPELSSLEISSNKSKKKGKKTARSNSIATHRDKAKLPVITSKKKKKKKRKHKSKSNYFGNNIYRQDDEKTNPCKFYQIMVTQEGVQCENLFDFPHLNVQHELTWFDPATKSLLLVLNNEQKRSIQLQIIRPNMFAADHEENAHASSSNNSNNALVQSMTDQLQIDAVSNMATAFKRRKRRKNSKKQQKHSAASVSSLGASAENKKHRHMSSSALFHEKLANQTLRIPLDAPGKHSHIFRDCQCLKLWHHSPTNCFLLLLEKYESTRNKKKRKSKKKKKQNQEDQDDFGLSVGDGVLGKLLLKLRINFMSLEIEHVSFGVVNEEDHEVIEHDNIVGYDYHRQLVILDTYYEPISPLSSNPLRSLSANKKMGLSPSSSTDMYQQYSKWFSFAAKPKKKNQVITKRFTAVGINDFVYHWTEIYDVHKK